jgi:hypothetical protein
MTNSLFKAFGRLLPALIVSLGLAPPLWAQTVAVINMIPNSRSNETERDSECNVAVDPANPLRIAASAFTPNPMGSLVSPIFISTDGGQTWLLNDVLPGGFKSDDTTIRFGGTSGVLYGAILRHDTMFRLNILRKPDFTAPGAMDIMLERDSVDQPYVEAATVVLGPSGTGSDRVYIGNNNGLKSATVDQSLSAATAPAPAGFNPIGIETRASIQDSPSIRPAIHLDGTIYAAYLGWRSFVGGNTHMDVVVARDDHWAAGATPYRDLIDAGDMQPGLRVAIDTQVLPLNTLLGTQRVGSNLSIAVDPRDSGTVYLAWADGITPDTYTIHLRRSTNRGATWSGDLRAVAPATNGSVAIDGFGKVGFLYQKHTTPAGGPRWETHLELSDDGFATVNDLVLANVPDSNGAYLSINPIGDYTHLMALGKTFYGVFSANNTPDMANFPSGVNYQRNADFASHTLKDLANNPVNVSIDPFFVKVTGQTPSDDFYVRDWTDSPASGDNGVEPSTHAVFYNTSDVWNRRGPSPGTFPNDQPEGLDAGNGPGNIGDNWMFARIRRNVAAAAGSKTVTAHFLVSKFGTGSNYIDATSGDPDLSFPDPDPTIVFNAADVGPVTTVPYQWHLNPIASNHFCIAVEISSPGDPFIPPSLLGNTPGWPTTDLRVINDNSKAQRNIGLTTTPATGSSDRLCLFALAHNAATFRRPIVLRYSAPPAVAGRLKDARIEVVGGRTAPFRPGARVTLENMLPGEDRWVCLNFPIPEAREGELLGINVEELVGETVVNGFTQAAQPAPIEKAIHDTLVLHLGLFHRAVAGFGLSQAKGEIEEATRLLKEKVVKEGEYLEFHRSRIEAVVRYVKELTQASESNPFHTGEAAEALAQAIRSGDTARICVAHTSLLNTLDSFLTMRELSRGNPADILQTVRWQRELYDTLSELAGQPFAAAIHDQSTRFIKDYGARKRGNKEYPALLRELLPPLQATAALPSLSSLKLEQNVAEIRESLGDTTALQRAHRGLLLKLQTLVK